MNRCNACSVQYEPNFDRDNPATIRKVLDNCEKELREFVASTKSQEMICQEKKFMLNCNNPDSGVSLDDLMKAQVELYKKLDEEEAAEKYWNDLDDNPAEVCLDSDMDWYYNSVVCEENCLNEMEESLLVAENREIAVEDYQKYVLNNFLTTLNDLAFVARSGVREIEFPMNVEGDWDALMKLEKAGVHWRLDLFSDTFFVRF